VSASKPAASGNHLIGAPDPRTQLLHVYNKPPAFERVEIPDEEVGIGRGFTPPATTSPASSGLRSAGPGRRAAGLLVLGGTTSSRAEEEAPGTFPGRGIGTADGKWVRCPAVNTLYEL